MNNPLRLLPSIKDIQDSPVFQKWEATTKISDVYLTKIAQKVVDFIRNDLLKNGSQRSHTDKDILFKHILDIFDKEVSNVLAPVITKVVNGTGVILHTNLGRARLSDEAVKTIENTAKSYSDLEFDLEKGERGSRYKKIEELLTLLTGAEAAMVVNNNAAAVFLILRAFAKDREVIVSRGELVEIGGSFRVSSIMVESDAKLVEVGTTNKTHLQDYITAITEETSMLMKVHRSNFAMIGFTEEVDRKELASLSERHNLIFYEDLGSGAFFDYKNMGIGAEPVISGILKDGVDLISASGDKLFGGPQAGIILGKKALIDLLKNHQLNRALRVDKLTLAGLAQTIQSYFTDEGVFNVPTVRDITQSIEIVLNRARQLEILLKEVKFVDVKCCKTTAVVGGGTMPGVTVDSYGVKVTYNGMPAHDLAKTLRIGTPSVIGRVEDDHFILDCRSMTDEETELVFEAFKTIGN